MENRKMTGMGNFNFRPGLVLVLILLLGMMAAGCGAASKSAATETAVQDNCSEAAYATDDIYSTEVMPEAAAGYTEEGGTGASVVQVQDVQRKLIRDVNLEVETETFEELLSTVGEKTRNLGGYIEESYTYNGSNYYGKGTRNANLTIRIPAEKLDEFLLAVGEVSNVISRNESVTDVTLEYVDLESHKKVLLAEQERLLELLEKAETIEDIISLESRLSQVRYQIESMEAQLRTMDNRVNYSTVYLYINEVAKLTPVKEQTVWEKISTGFASSLYNVGEGFVNFGIGFIIFLPYLLVWVIIIVVFTLLLKLLIKCAVKKRQKKIKENKTKEKHETEQTEAKEK
ncbi:hypothetical protein C819_00230 [Lachnospiraceae bacterium 10-1]|nr:hypothetical protein C819_00230 [Lachnospiraceae bacterium 10-1]